MYRFSMRKLVAIVVAMTFLGSGVAVAHQPVSLLDSDTTAAKGPLLVDGTVSFAIRAAFTKPGQKKAFRAQFQAGDQISVQYLIVDRKPENAVRATALPTLVMTGPQGTKPVTMKLNERTKFYEPYGRTNYLYLGRYSGTAVAGVYNFVINSRGRAAITVAVGDKEIPGEVVRGPVPASTAVASPAPVVTPTATATPAPVVTPTPTPTATPTSTPTPTPTATATPTPTPTIAGYTMAQVRANNSARSCWTAIDGFVYDLTRWISSHPGGSGAILFLCGTDGTNAFKSQHDNQARPAIRLDGYKLGPLNK
jgi:hypothetical protein